MFSRLEFTFYAAISTILIFPQFLICYFLNIVTYLRCTFSHSKFESSNLINPDYWLKKYSYSLRNKIVIVTGGNTGIGKETATLLCLCGATVILACRDDIKAQEACKDIENKLLKLSQQYPYGKYGSVKYMNLDLSSLVSVVKFSNEFKKHFQRLDILINNAGLNGNGQTKTDNIQQIFQVNFLGHFLLFNLLKSLLSMKEGSDSNYGRVINLSSVMHHVGTNNFLLHDYVTGKNKSSYYGDSKLYMNYLTLEINRRYRRHSSKSTNRCIRAISVNPGAVRSSIWREIPQPFLFFYDLLMRILYLDVVEGSATSVVATILDDYVLDAYEDRYAGNIDCCLKGNVKWCYHPLIPYIIPYALPLRILSFECAGPFIPPRFGEISLPKSSLQTSESLWNWCISLCKERNIFT